MISFCLLFGYITRCTSIKLTIKLIYPILLEELSLDGIFIKLKLLFCLLTQKKGALKRKYDVIRNEYLNIPLQKVPITTNETQNK